MSIDIGKLIENTLSPIGYPVKAIKHKKTYETYITYFELNNFEEDYSDGEAETEVYSLQIDLFSKKDIKKIKQEIKKALKGTFSEVTYNDVTEEENYHVVFRCYFYV